MAPSKPRSAAPSRPAARRVPPRPGDPHEAEIAALAAMPDDAIDTSDMPEVTDWTGAVRGR